MCLQLVGLLVTIQTHQDYFGETAQFNFERYVDAEGTAIMDKISSTESFDSAKNVEYHKEWQKYVHDKAFIFPTLVGEELTAVNKRVKYYDVNLGSKKSALYQVELPSDTGAK